MKQIGLSATVLPFVSGAGVAVPGTALIFEDDFEYTNSPLNHGWQEDFRGGKDYSGDLEVDGDILTMDAKGGGNHVNLYQEISQNETVAPHVEMRARSVSNYAFGEGKVRIAITADNQSLSSTNERVLLVLTEGNHDDFLTVETQAGKKTVRSSEVDSTQWQQMVVWFDGEKTYAGTRSNQFLGVDRSPDRSKDFRVYISNGSNVTEHDYVKVSRIQETIEVDVDIKPDDDQNSINPNSKGVTPVAVLSTESFDPVARVRVGSVRFGDPQTVEDGGGASPAHGGHAEDVTGNGDDDLVLHFPTKESGFDGDEDVGRLEGETTDGTPLFGEDSVEIVGGNGGKGKDGQGRGPP